MRRRGGYSRRGSGLGGGCGCVLLLIAAFAILAGIINAADARRAGAHEGVFAYHGNSYSHLTHSHNRAWVCDREVDGNREYAVFGKAGRSFSVTDTRGGDGVCATRNPSDFGAAEWIYTCEPGVGCGRTRWH